MAAIPAGQQTQHETHGGAGITAIEHLGGLLQPIKSNPLHCDGFSIFDGADGHSHRPQASSGADRVFRRQQTLDRGLSFRNGTEQQRPV